MPLILGEVFSDKGSECSFHGTRSAMFTSIKEVKRHKKDF